MLQLKVKFLKGQAEKIMGLIKYQKACPVFFKTHWGIHTFGLKFPIDVLILDSEYKVIKTVTGLLPKRVFLWPPVYENVVELPFGEVRRLKIKTGDKILLVPNVN
jgi:hypothetical protein